MIAEHDLTCPMVLHESKKRKILDEKHYTKTLAVNSQFMIGNESRADGEKKKRCFKGGKGPFPC